MLVGRNRQSDRKSVDIVAVMVGRGEGEDQPNFMFIKVQLAGLSVQLDTNPIGSLQRSTLCLLRQRQTGKINIRQNVCKLLNCGQKSLLLIPTRAASLFRLSLLFKEILSQWVHWFYQRRSGIRKNQTKRSKISFDFGDILLSSTGCSSTTVCRSVQV